MICSKQNLYFSDKPYFPPPLFFGARLVYFICFVLVLSFSYGRLPTGHITFSLIRFGQGLIAASVLIWLYRKKFFKAQ